MFIFQDKTYLKNPRKRLSLENLKSKCCDEIYLVDKQTLEEKFSDKILMPKPLSPKQKSEFLKNVKIIVPATR